MDFDCNFRISPGIFGSRIVFRTVHSLLDDLFILFGCIDILGCIFNRNKKESVLSVFAGYLYSFYRSNLHLCDFSQPPMGE
jgi:hypothetical protein